MEIQTGCGRLGWAGAEAGAGAGERKYHLNYKMAEISSLYFIPSGVDKLSVTCVRVVSL